MKSSRKRYLCGVDVPLSSAEGNGTQPTAETIMKTVSVICGTPPTVNPGMYSVDLAFDALMRRYDIDVHVNYYLFEDIPPFLVDDTDLPFKYKCFRNKLGEILDSDALVFWGDFNQSYQYHRTSGFALMQSKGIVDNENEAFDMFQRHYMLEGAADNVLRKTALFGISVLPNDTVDERGRRHRSNFKRLIQSSKCAMARDVFSALKISHVSGDYMDDHLGVDCALLLQNADLTSLPTSSHLDSSSADNRVGVFFGRSTDYRPLVQFTIEFCRATGLQPDWIPWLKGNVGEMSTLLGVTVNDGAAELEALCSQMTKSEKEQLRLGDVYSAVAKCKLIITDTYHLTLNAWRMGTPVICIGRGTSPNTRAVHDKKKEFFHSMYEALAFYVFYEDISDPSKRDQMIASLVDVMRNHALVDTICDNITSHRGSAERRFMASFGPLVQ